MRSQSAQALVEWAASAMVLLLFAFGILAVGSAVNGYMAVRSAASQAAFAAARAPGARAAQDAGRQAATEAAGGSGVRDFQVSIDTRGFQRGGTLTVVTTGCASLLVFPVVSQVLGPCVPLRWTAHALVEPYRSRSAAP